MSDTTFFPSKLLLFGEYTVVRGSQALALPLDLYSGQWAYQKTPPIDANLLAFNAYLEKLVADGRLDLDTEGFKNDLSKGLFFQSTIPSGYGAGSSGAVTAGILARYGKNAFDNLNAADLPQLKAILGLMESHFHGSSSGLDPLVSFVKKPIFINSSQKMDIVRKPENNLSIFLLDTLQPRKTEPLVKRFLELCNTNSEYKTLIDNELAPSVNEAIAAYLNSQSDTLFGIVHHISHFQYRFFDEMIPSRFKNVWLEGLSSEAFKLKLCGAGGGGFILGFAKNWETAQQKLHLMGFQPIRISS
jgi:mevalonate kinase